MRKWLTRFMAAAMLASGMAAGAGGMPAAAADTVKPYLYWSEDRGHCGGEWRTYIGTRTYDPATHSVKRHKRTETSSTSKTEIYNQNGVRTAKVYDECINGRIVRKYNPTVYRHRSIKVSFVCFAGRCTRTSTLYGSWLNGTGKPL
ncbi:hypothetical protein ACIBI7_10685 [Nonomuraea fuscirosea]|uniref:hypothetical protein n=1 Tax=Nonomuraea fuscirosea TaxID=1291556 RepID=UPI003485B57C